MIRAHAGADYGNARRRRHRLGAFAALTALFFGLFVGAARPAHALITPCTDPTFCPVANADEYTVTFGQKLIINAVNGNGLLANDEGPVNGNTHVYLPDTDTSSFPGNATVAVKSDGSFTYTPVLSDPTALFSGDDSFLYSIIDGAGDEDFNYVTIHVRAVVNPVSFGTQINHQLNVPAPGALKTDLGLDPTQATLNSPSAQGGTVVDNGNGAFLYTPPTGFSGTDSFTYDAWDYDTDVDYTGTVTIYVDGTPPTVSMSAPPTVTEGTRVTATWAGADDQGVASYDVQYQIAPWNGPFGPWTWFRQAVPASQHTGTLVENYGRTVCFRARARDFAGNVSPFVTRCTATALRATSLGYSPLWTRLTSSAFFGRYAERTVYKGQSALLNSVQAKHLWLVATRCPSCGTVTVRWKGVGIKAINLAYPATQHNVLFPIASFAAPQAGPVQVIVTSPSGRQVVIQGLAVSRV